MDTEAVSKPTKNYLPYFVLSVILLIVSLTAVGFLIFQRYFSGNSTETPVLSPTQVVVTSTPVPLAKEIRLESKENPDYVRILSMKNPPNTELKTTLVPDGKNDKLVISYKQAELTIKTINPRNYDAINERVKGTAIDPNWSDLVLIGSDGNFDNYVFGDKITWDDDIGCAKMVGQCYRNILSISSTPVFYWRASIKIPKGDSYGSMAVFKEMITNASELVRINATYKIPSEDEYNPLDYDPKDILTFRVSVDASGVPDDELINLTDSYDTYYLSKNLLSDFPSVPEMSDGLKLHIEGRFASTTTGTGDFADFFKFYEITKITN
jgi:hypothetical protein